MRWSVVLLAALSGCLWIDDRMHEARQNGPDTDTEGDTDADADTDTDTDADTDTDTDADTDTDVPVDADGDGFPEEVDCDDGDENVNPDADDLCGDGKDGDCDGDDALAGTVTLEDGGAWETYPGLQEALDATASATAPTIYVCGGTHPGPFDVDHPVVIEGVGEVPVLQGDGSGAVVILNGGGAAAGPPDDEDITLRNLEITGGAGGSGIDGRSKTIFLEDLDVHDNETDEDGGGLRLGGIVEMDGVHVHDNVALRGGGIALMGASVTMNDVTIDANTADDIGGGMVIQSSKVTGDRTTVSVIDNTCERGSGVIVIHEEAALPPDLDASSLTGMEIRSNEGPGAGLELAAGMGSDANIEVTDVVVREHLLAGEGGGLRLRGPGGTITLEAVHLDANTAQDGAGLYSDFGGTLLLLGSGADDNAATRDGGGIFASAGTVQFLGDTLARNSAAGDGDAVRITGGATFVKCDTTATVNGEVANDESAATSLPADCSETTSTGDVGVAATCSCP